MNKREALRILIENSFLPEEVKVDLLFKIDQLSDTDMESIGKFLAAEQQINLDNKEEDLKKLDQLIAEIDKLQGTPTAG